MAGSGEVLGRVSCKFVELDEVDFNSTRTFGAQWAKHKTVVDYLIKRYLERNTIDYDTIISNYLANNTGYTNGRFEL